MVRSTCIWTPYSLLWLGYASLGVDVYLIMYGHVLIGDKKSLFIDARFLLNVVPVASLCQSSSSINTPPYPTTTFVMHAPPCYVHDMSVASLLFATLSSDLLPLT